MQRQPARVAIVERQRVSTAAAPGVPRSAIVLRAALLAVLLAVAYRYSWLTLVRSPTGSLVGGAVAALLSARIFLMPYIITGGGPGNATRVLSMLIYETGFSYMKMGRAAAISVVLFAIMMVFTFLQMRIFMSREQV